MACREQEDPSVGFVVVSRDIEGVRLMKQDRRDPYPWTWEPLGAGVLAFGLLLLLGVHIGRGIACVAVGAGWCWPRRESLVPSVWPVLSGDAGAGLAKPVEVSREALVTLIVLAVVGLLLLAVGVAVWLVRCWGPGSLKGVASPGEVERLLGRRRLYRARKVVRPDLYGRLSRHEDQEAQDVTV